VSEMHGTARFLRLVRAVPIGRFSRGRNQVLVINRFDIPNDLLLNAGFGSGFDNFSRNASEIYFVANTCSS